MAASYNRNRRGSKEKAQQDAMERAIIPEVRADQAVDFVVEHLATSEYKADLVESVNVQPDHMFDENSKVWRALLDGLVHANTVIELKNFNLTEWVPRSPGTYHTVVAMEAREEAWNYRIPETEFRRGPDRFSPMSNAAPYDWEIYSSQSRLKKDSFYTNAPIVFAPRGKLSMIQGGIGCVRLQPLKLREELFWLWGATSSNVAHEGMPVAIRDTDYNRFADDVINGGIACDLIGRIRYIKPSGQLEYSRRIPRFYLEIESINLQNSGRGGFKGLFTRSRTRNASCLVCAAVSFEHAGDGLLATYASFQSENRESFARAIEWMEEEYVQRLYRGKIVTDFDETSSPFSDALFSLKDVMNGRVSKEATKVLLSINEGYYANRVINAIEKVNSITIEKVGTMNMKTINIGANATISAPITIADSIENSFNAIQNSSNSDDINRTLQELIKLIANVAPSIPERTSKELARDANDLVREATDGDPRNDVCRTLLDRVSKSAAALGTIGVPLINCAAALLKFFS